MSETSSLDGEDDRPSSQSTTSTVRFPEVEEFTVRVRKLEEHDIDYDHWFLHDFGPFAGSFADYFARTKSPGFASDEVKMAITQLWHTMNQADKDIVTWIKAKNYLAAFALITMKIEAVLRGSAFWPMYKLADGAAVTLWNQYWGKDPPCRVGSSVVGLGAQNHFTQGLQAVLVRSEYEVAYQAIQEQQRLSPTGGMTITGHDGIGKSLLIFYLLALRLSAKEITIFQGEPDYYTVFLQKGVYRIPICKPLEAFEIYIPAGTWALVDSNGCDFGRPTESRERGFPFFVIEVTGLRHGRRTVWIKKERSIGTFFMKPWSREEITLGCSMQHTPGQSSSEELDYFCHNYGPLPRIVYGYPQISDYTISICSFIHNMRWSHLLHALKGDGMLCTTSWSNQLFLFEPTASDDRSDFHVSVITWRVKKILWEGLWGRSHPIIKADAQEFFSLAQASRRTLPLAHWMLEFTVRDALLRRERLTLYTMRDEWRDRLVDEVQTYTYFQTKEFGVSSSYHIPVTRLNHTPLDPLNAPVLEPGAYYATSVLDRAKFPYFIYDPHDRKHLFITMIDVAASYEAHTIDTEGLEELCRFVQSKGINAWQMRYVVTIDRLHPVELEVIVPPGYLSWIDLYVLNIAVT